MYLILILIIKVNWNVQFCYYLMYKKLHYQNIRIQFQAYNQMQYFWLDCSENNCVRQGIYFGANFIIFIFNVVCVINTVRHYKKLHFQLLPLTINTLVTFTLIFLTLVELSYQFTILIEIFEIYSYFLFTFTFAMINLQEDHFNSQLFNLKKKPYFIIFFAVTAIFLGCIITIIIEYKKITCTYIKQSFFGGFSLQFIIYIITLYYCYLIWKKIINHIQIEAKLMAEKLKQGRVFHDHDYSIEIRLKQIKLLVLSFSLTIIFRIFFLLETFVNQIPISCITITNGTQVLSSNQLIGIILITIGDIGTLIPYIFIPIILYIIPIYSRAQLYELKIANKSPQQKKQLLLEQKLIQQFTSEFFTQSKLRQKYKQINSTYQKKSFE